MDRETEKMLYLQNVFLVECALREWNSDKISNHIINKEKIIKSRADEMIDDYVWYEENEDRLKEKEL